MTSGLGGVGSICSNVVRLQPGERHYDACVQSLSRTLGNASSGVALSHARDACQRRGFAPGTPALAECTLSAADTSPATGLDPPPSDRTVAPPGGTRSYFAVSPGMALRRDQLACAELGLDPTDAAFSACAIDLRAALAAADNPMN